eukprot:3523503-Rhodomonas_salina.1
MVLMRRGCAGGNSVVRSHAGLGHAGQAGQVVGQAGQVGQVGLGHAGQVAGQVVQAAFGHALKAARGHAGLEQLLRGKGARE